jgi:hypothetical protein
MTESVDFPQSALFNLVELADRMPFWKIADGDGASARLCITAGVSLNPPSTTYR